MKKTEFENMVDKAFWGLEAKYGFKKTETSYVERTCTVQFKNATTEVLLNYELGNTPWLEISDDPQSREQVHAWMAAGRIGCGGCPRNRNRHFTRPRWAKARSTPAFKKWANSYWSMAQTF